MSANHWRRRVDKRLSGGDDRPAPPRRPSRRSRADAPEKATNGAGGPAVDPAVQKPSADTRESGPLRVVPAAPTLVPPPPAEVPPAESEQAEEINLRFVVLSICFLAGLGLGFLYHLGKGPEVADERDAAAPIPVVDVGGDGEPDRAHPVVEAVAVPTADTEAEKEVEAVLETMGQAPSLVGQLPEAFDPAKQVVFLSKTPYGGLTGRNAPLPPYVRQAESGTRPGPGGPELEPVEPELAPELDMDL